MAQNDIDDVLDQLRRIKRGGDLSSVKVDQIETLEMEIRFFRIFSKYNHFLLPNSIVKITKKARRIVKMLHSVYDGIPDEFKTNLNLERLESHLLEFIDGDTSLRHNYVLNVSDLLEYMDCLDKNLNDVRMCTNGHMFLWINRFIKQLKTIQKKMRFLRYLYVSEINENVDHEKLQGLKTRIQFMADNVGKLWFFFWVYEDENDKDEDVNDILSKPPYLLFLVVIVELEMQKIFLGELKTSKFSQSRTFSDRKLPKGFSYNLCNLLVYLSNEKLKNFLANVTGRNIDVAMEFLLLFLGDVPNHVINGKKLNKFLVNIGVLVGDILCVTQMLLSGSTIKEDAIKIDLSPMQILEKIEDLKAQVGTCYKSLKFTPSHEFPMVGGLSFLHSLLRKLNEMLKSETGFNFMMKPHIGILEKEISSLASVFRDGEKVKREHKILEDSWKHIINLAYEAELDIDFILSQCNTLWHSFCSLPAIIKEITHINVEVTQMRPVNLAQTPCCAVEPFKHLQTRYRNPYLVGGTNELDVLPIVSMEGQGKTTIARKVFNSNVIVNHFDARAWCIISQTYDRSYLLQEIFRQVTNSRETGDKDDILADKLRKKLMEKRYLIVLDDIWDGMAWDVLRLSFPNVGNGSRIVVITRLEKVGEHVMHHIDPHTLPFLPPDESRKLLHKKVFQQEGCPPELQHLSREIAERCKGLPLVIGLVAGIIKRNKMEASWWNEVKNSLLSYLGESEGYSLLTMQLSYDNLPDYVKPCLLYMGMFPEDEGIPVTKLISLWIAEGFVQNVESGRSMEDAAEGYLMDLVRSKVVMVSRRRYNGKVKYCQVHDVVLHFCLEKSREEKFILAVKGQFQPSHWKESRVSFNYSNKISKFASPGSETRKPFHPHLRSLITTNEAEWSLFHQISKLRLLKVLDLSSHKVRVLSSATFQPLIQLKYVAVETTQFDFYPESHLPNLETLKSFSNHMLIPSIFWKMKNLRHVDMKSAEYDLEEDMWGVFEESSKLENLRILRGVVIKTGDVESVHVLIRRCPNLQELDISFWDDNDSPEICPELESLMQLQTLYLSFDIHLVLSGLHLPSNLKKLGLKCIPIESVLSVIAGLPSLEYLQLWNAVKSKEWFLRDVKFHKLKFLKLVDLSISRLDASEESFPLLETLVVLGCHYLKEVPLIFADIPTLKQIRLSSCASKSLKASAVRIKEEVEEIEGCDRVDITIIPSSKNKLLNFVSELHLY
ncbi:hypothetical protein P3S68_023975 [Capsicum galapagoense]